MTKIDLKNREGLVMCIKATLMTYTSEIWNMELTEDGEHVEVTYPGGVVDIINIAGDSNMAAFQDIARGLRL